MLTTYGIIYEKSAWLGSVETEAVLREQLEELLEKIASFRIAEMK